MAEPRIYNWTGFTVIDDKNFRLIRQDETERHVYINSENRNGIKVQCAFRAAFISELSTIGGRCIRIGVGGGGFCWPLLKKSSRASLSCLKIIWRRLNLVGNYSICCFSYYNWISYKEFE